MPALAAEDVEKAARLLWRNWQNGSRLDSLPMSCRPISRADGYAIAQVLAETSGQTVVGWKIAATSEAGQRHINVDGPLAGRILSGRVLESGASIPLGSNVMRVVEAEFAFRFGKDLASRDGGYEKEEVLSAVTSLHLSMEVPDSRYHNFLSVGAPQLIADTACACWLILSADVEGSWRNIDLAEHAVEARVDGRRVASGTGKAVLGDPRVALTWLVNEVTQHGGGIKSSQFVTTGTCIVPVAIEPGVHVELDFGIFGKLAAIIA